MMSTACRTKENIESTLYMLKRAITLTSLNIRCKCNWEFNF